MIQVEMSKSHAKFTVGTFYVKTYILTFRLLCLPVKFENLCGIRFP